MKVSLNFKNVRAAMYKKETISVLILISFVGAVFMSMFMSPQLYQGSVHEGDIALKDIYAPYDFTYFWEIDDEGTAKAKEIAAKNIPFFLRRDTASEKNILSETERFYVSVISEKDRNIPLSEKLEAVKTGINGEFPEKTLKFIFQHPDVSAIHERTKNVIKKAFEVGYPSEEDLKFVSENGSGRVVIMNGEGSLSLEKGAIELLSAQNMNAILEEMALEFFSDDRKTRQAVTAVAGMYLRPNTVIDEERTEAAKEEAVKKVGPVYKSWSVEKDELLIEKGKRVNARHIAQLTHLRRIFRPGTSPAFFVGVLFFFILLGVIAAVYMSFSQRKNILSEPKNIAMPLLHIFILLMIADFIMRSPQPSYFIPMASLGMSLTLLTGFGIAFISTILTSIFISMLIGGGVKIAFVLILGSMVGMFVVRGARRRARILWAGIIAGGAKFLGIACIGLINGMGVDFFIKDGIWGMASGIFSGFIVMGLLPVFEHIFKVSTNISLLELSDLNHPVLKKLAIEAPGTYHHSIMVGNLAEVASEAIGADSLRARVGAYYHDIGKIPKAEYFSENEMGSGSRHAKLAPSMSSLIISKHVKDGVEIAKKYKLNNSIIAFITQHHGNSLIAYFYQKAMEKAENAESLDEESFRYPGPKPQTKETAIVLLADSVEASSRTLVDPNPSSIRNLVKKIINNKFIDGQLDECDLTLRDMHKIAESFERVLMGVFHTRLKYPEESKKDEDITGTNGNTDKQRKQKQQNKNRPDEDQ
ncbi:MAG: HDIG domain-containing metalloprotein [Candidatus Omnitrophota bacterium]|nr:HDIG domain-containing protein [Candidatus Omnitrophota bacterium]